MSFKASDHKDKKASFDLLPVGKYALQLTSAAKKEARGGGNYYVACRFTVVEGKYQGRLIFVNLNLQNSNEVAQEIAEGELSHLMSAVGVGSLKDKWDLTKLLHITFTGTVSVEKSKNPAYDDSNRIATYTAEAGGKQGKKGKKGKKARKVGDAPF